MEDTSKQSRDRYHALLRARLPYERLEAAMRLSRAVRALAEAGIRARHPMAGPDEVRVRLAVRMYGREVAAKLFRDLPDDAT